MTERDSSRQRLLQAARDLFAQHGYDGTSVRAITSRAKVNLAAVTYHFGSKEELFHAVIRTIAEPLVDAVTRAAQAPGTPVERIQAMTRAAGEHVQAHPWAPRVMLRELASDRRMPPPMVEAWRRNIGTLSAVIAEGQRDGSIRPGEPRLLALSAIGQVFFFRVAGRITREVAGVDPNDPELRQRIADHIADNVRRLLATDPPKADS